MKLRPIAEVHTNPLRQALLKMLGDNPSLNDSRFNGGFWVNLKCERIWIILKHLRKVRGQEETKNLASKLTAAEFTLLKGLVNKVEVKEDVEKGCGNTKKKLKKNDSEISLDRTGYPKCLLSPPKALAIEDAKPGALSKGSGSPALTKGKGGAMPSVPKYLTQKKPGHKYDPPCSKDAPLKAMARRPWHKLRITHARKPERSYIIGCYKGECKLKLIVEASGKRCEKRGH